MKRILSVLILLIYITSFGQSHEIGLEYSFELDIKNEDIKERLTENPEFNISESFKVFYTDHGVVRYIENSNNFIQSSVFNKSKNKLTLFDSTEVLKIETGDFNKPEVKSTKSVSKNEIIFETKTGSYSYYFDVEKLQLDKEIVKDLGEHCLNIFVTKTGVLPLTFTCDIGIMEFRCELKKEISLESNDVAMLNKLIENANEAELSKFIAFVKME